MDRYRLVLIGGSAGSVNVLLKIIPSLRADLDLPLVIILHRRAGNDSLLTELIAARTSLRVKELEEKEFLTPGTIYISPPSYHTLIEKDESFSLDASEKVNFSRPAIDVTFESAAAVYGKELFALLLSGANSDGTLGLIEIKQHGGLVAVQDPESAVVSFMPHHAQEHAEVELSLKIEEIAPFINQLNDSFTS